MKLRVMSFNIFCGILTDERISRVVKNIKAESPHIVGMQEGMDSSRKMLEAALGDEYAILGDGRNDDRRGENCNVMYKKSAFDLMETKTVWLTDTPDEYSVYEGSCCPRILTYQLLRHKDSGRVILHVNTHLDHVLPEVRTRQAQTLVKYVAENIGDHPTFITGDFNCEMTEDAFSVITAAGYEATTGYGEYIPTYQGFDNGPTMNIDYTFVGGDFTVLSYKVCDELYDGEHPSDHNAIVSEIEL
ncbi:MAG: endonuclease/exonuclease/phosphatase family protein [Clostridia bacterium]|nr:endonuclease/exonuclease/phosphatase family protein [Clostridia bacterium]